MPWVKNLTKIRFDLVSYVIQTPNGNLYQNLYFKNEKQIIVGDLISRTGYATILKPNRQFL